MEARTIGWSIAALVIGTFGIVAMSAVEKATASRDLARANEALTEAKNDLENSKTARLRMMERVAQASELKKARTGATEEVSSIEAAVTAAGQKEDGARQAWEAERDAYEASVKTVRSKVVGTKLARVETGGITLEDVTVKGVTLGIVTLEHSAGLTKVPTAKLPADLTSSLVPDWNPTLAVKELTDAPAAITRTEEEPDSESDPSAPPAAAFPPPAAGGTSNPHTPARIRLEKERTNLSLKMDAARGEQQLQTKKYYELNAQYQNSRARSKTVTIPPGMEDARKTAENIGRQIETARQQYNRMTVQLQELVNKEAAWTPAAQ